MVCEAPPGIVSPAFLPGRRAFSNWLSLRSFPPPAMQSYTTLAWLPSFHIINSGARFKRVRVARNIPLRRRSIMTREAVLFFPNRRSIFCTLS